MKKWIPVLIVMLVLVAGFVVYGSSGNSDGQEYESESTVTQAEGASESQSGDAAESDSNILVAYFTAAENSGVDAVSSASVTMIDDEPYGVSQAVANMIAEETGGDLFSIQTNVVYPADINELIDYVAEEQDEGVMPELTTHIENLDDYDTIFIGFPIWWYDMPQVMYSFFDEYDFSGKTIIPFTVHNGSRLSGTPATIQELEPDAVVIEDGFSVSQGSAADAAADVAKWLDGLEYQED